VNRVASPSSDPDRRSDPGAAARKAAVEKWRRRSAHVHFWRKALPASIVAIVVCIAGWGIARGLMPEPALAPIDLSAIRMKGPQFFGRDNNDRAFLLYAKEAIRDAREEGRITLSNPTFNLGGGKVRADRGIYVDGSTDIILRGNVVVIDGDGGRMETQEALIDTRTGIVTNRRAPAAKGVQIESRMGKISAQDYAVAKDGSVTFRGGVRGTINAQ
jgi:lipopolysaccharide export system protein LptC